MAALSGPRWGDVEVVPPLPPPPPLEHEDLLRLFVGKNYEYYAKKWKLGEQRKSKNSWNWAAFFLVLNWGAYRKMYALSWFVIGVCVVEVICELAFGLSVTVSQAVNVAIAGWVGWVGNDAYKLHVEGKLREIAPTGASNEAIRMRLAKEGGTNLGAAVGFTVGLTILIILGGAIGS